MRQCDQSDLEDPKYRCSSTAEDGFDQCSKHRYAYIKELEASVVKLNQNRIGLQGSLDDCRKDRDYFVKQTSELEKKLTEISVLNTKNISITKELEIELRNKSEVSQCWFEKHLKLKKKLAYEQEAIRIKDDRIETLKRALNAAITMENIVNEKLKIAVEAMEFMCRYKSPDYYHNERGSMFMVAREALLKIKNVSEN